MHGLSCVQSDRVHFFALARSLPADDGNVPETQLPFREEPPLSVLSGPMATCRYIFLFVLLYPFLLDMGACRAGEPQASAYICFQRCGAIQFSLGLHCGRVSCVQYWCNLEMWFIGSLEIIKTAHAGRFVQLRVFGSRGTAHS